MRVQAGCAGAPGIIFVTWQRSCGARGTQAFKGLIRHIRVFVAWCLCFAEGWKTNKNKRSAKKQASGTETVESVLVLIRRQQVL